ncbi:MAG: sigma-70 family RNA polymerase sigma factor [Bacteroidota bacterium]
MARFIDQVIIGLNEQQLINELKSGSQQAFALIVEEYQEKVLNTCLGFVPDLQESEDLVQEVFIQVYQSISGFKGESSFSTWLYRIAVSKSLEHIRFKKRKKRASFFQSLIGLEGAIDTVSSDQFDHPGVKLENKEKTKILFNQIDKLSKNQRIAFVLHKVEGLSHKEVAEIMDVTVGAVESLLHRAKQNLRKQLKGYYQQQML